MTQTLSKQTPVDRRIEFIGACTQPIADRATAQKILEQAGQPNLLGDLTLADFTDIAVKMAEGQSKGKTDRWKAACTFAARSIESAEKAGMLTYQHARWAVVQGSVYMAHAAD